MNDNPANSNVTPEENLEWQLAELVDAIASEIDRAGDTLSLKSYARGVSFAIKKLSLDIEVKVRRTADGKLLFRTVGNDQMSATVLKLDFAQVLQNQLTTARKPLDGNLSVAGFSISELDALPQINPNEITALGTVGIHSVDDLERYTQTPLMIAELSRQIQIEEHRLRMWLQLPFITEVKPSKGPPGSTILIEGGNFGSQSSSNDQVFFQEKPAKIIDWREKRLTVEMPSEVSGIGLLVAQIGNQLTNAIQWEAAGVDLYVRDLIVSPAQPVAGEEIVVTADLINQGSLDSSAFEVQWEVDGEKQELQPHGLLRAQQKSEESTIRRKFTLSAGSHTIRFTADPEGKIFDINQTNGTFCKEVEVRPLQTLSIGDFRKIETLDPLLNDNLGPADVLSLLFRGLCRLNPETGQLEPDIAQSWETKIENDTRLFIVHLRDQMYFHNGQMLTADDVKFTYETIKQVNSTLGSLVNTIVKDITIEDNRTITFSLPSPGDRIASSDSVPPRSITRRLLTIGIVPQSLYQTDPKSFGRRPIGCGPFQCNSFTPGKIIRLGAFRKYVLGEPRLAQIDIHFNLDVNLLIDMLDRYEVTAAVLPYSARVESQLRGSGKWILKPLVESSESPESESLLHVQSTYIHERAPNVLNTNWNAHLWYYEQPPSREIQLSSTGPEFSIISLPAE
ncbi:MAG TPA: ABC transporter substrate-binding protein [Allocoleopsis sp.]